MLGTPRFLAVVAPLMPAFRAIASVKQTYIQVEQQPLFRILLTTLPVPGILSVPFCDPRLSIGCINCSGEILQRKVTPTTFAAAGLWTRVNWIRSAVTSTCTGSSLFIEQEYLLA